MSGRKYSKPRAKNRRKRASYVAQKAAQVASRPKRIKVTLADGTVVYRSQAYYDAAKRMRKR